MGGTKSVPEYWEPDDSTDSCRLCEQKFGALRRRHHCRFPTCGSLVCDDCSKHRSVIPGYNYKGPQRICDRCKIRDSAIAAAAAASGHGAASGSGGTRTSVGPQRANSFDPSYAGAASDGAWGARGATTPRAASSLAVIEADRNRRAVTPRMSAGAGSPNRLPLAGGGGGAVVRSSSTLLGATNRSNTSGVAAASPAGRPPAAPSAASAAAAAATTSSGGVPTPLRYVRAVLQLVVASPTLRRACYAAGSASSPSKDRAAIGRAVLSFLRQPTVWIERASISAHRSSLAVAASSSNKQAEDWTTLLLGQRVAAGMSNANTAAASALFLSAPALPSTRPATVWLFFTTRSRAPPSSAAAVSPLSVLRNIQVGVVHESITSLRTRPNAPASAHSTNVASLSSQRVPSIGVCLEGSSFVGAKTEGLEFFRLADAVTAVVVAITFDQGSGNVAFTLHNASGAAASATSAPNSARESIGARSPATRGSAGPSPGAAQGAVSSAVSYPVLAAHACPLPSGVAGKWSAAFSVDTSKLDDASTLVAEWL